MGARGVGEAKSRLTCFVGWDVGLRIKAGGRRCQAGACMRGPMDCLGRESETESLQVDVDASWWLWHVRWREFLV